MHPNCLSELYSIVNITLEEWICCKIPWMSGYGWIRWVSWRNPCLRQPWTFWKCQEMSDFGLVWNYCMCQRPKIGCCHVNSWCGQLFCGYLVPVKLLKIHLVSAKQSIWNILKKCASNSDQQIVISPANGNRNRFAEPTSVRIGTGIVYESQNLQIGIGITFVRWELFANYSQIFY